MRQQVRLDISFYSAIIINYFYNVSKSLAIPDEVVVSKIYLIRKQKVMLDADMADLYQVETRRLNEQVRETWIGFLKTLCSS